MAAVVVAVVVVILLPVHRFSLASLEVLPIHIQQVEAEPKGRMAHLQLLEPKGLTVIPDQVGLEEAEGEPR